MILTKGKVVGIISIKGGVGKTTTVVNLAHVLANDFGKKIAVIDANFSAPNISLHLGSTGNKHTLHDVLNGKAKLHEALYEHNFGFHVINTTPNSNTSNLNFQRLKQKLQQLKNHYDFILVDSSPNLNNEMLAAMVASDELYVISTPDIPTLTTTLKAVKVAKDKKMKINGLILNKVRGKNYELKSKDMEKLSGIPLIGVIKDNIRILEALSLVKPAAKLNPNSNITIAYKKIAANIAGIDYKEPAVHKKIIGYLKDDFKNLVTHKFSKGISYYK